MNKSTEKVNNIAASIGGNAILISHDQIQWYQYNEAVTTGSASIYDYGYGFYGFNLTLLLIP